MKFPTLCIIIYCFLLISCSDQSLLSTTEGSPLQWKGARSSDPTPPQLNWAYYNTSLKTSLIFNGKTWEVMAVSGIDGKNVRWLGMLDTFPSNPELCANSAFFYNVDSTSYLFNGTTWSIMTPAGIDGKDIVWQGDRGKAPEKPELNWAYHDTIQKKSFIYNGTKWDLFSADGINGQKVIWKGPSNKHLPLPEKNWGYYNTIDRTSYLFDGISWKVITKDGLDAPQGDPMIWVGEFPTPPENPKLNWMYRNSTDGCSYIWDGIVWSMIAKIGNNGVPIIWKGDWYESPLEPRINWAYFNLTDNSSYIFNGRDWQILSKSGLNGLDGIALNWRGYSDYHPEKPAVNWVYYNQQKGITYIYDGVRWEVFCKDGSTTTRYRREKVAFGDTLILNHGFNSLDYTSTTHYYRYGDNSIYSWDIEDSLWKQSFEIMIDTLLYTAQTTAPDQHLYSHKNGTLIHLYSEHIGIAQGTRFFTTDYQGKPGVSKTLTDDSCTIQNFFVLGDDSYGFAYLSFPTAATSEARIALFHPNGTRKDILVGSGFSAFRVNAYEDTALFCAWIKGNEAHWSRIASNGEELGSARIISDIDSAFTQNIQIRTYPDGRTFFVLERSGPYETLAGFIGKNGTLYDTVPSFFRVSSQEPILLDNYTAIADTWVYEGRRFSTKYAELTTGNSIGSSKKFRMGSMKAASNISFSTDDNKNTLAIQTEPFSDKDAYFSQLFYVDKDLNELTRQSLSTKYVTPRVVAIDDETFAISYVDRTATRNVRFAVLKRAVDTPRIVVKRLDLDRIAVINRTGVEIDVMVSATKGYR